MDVFKLGDVFVASGMFKDINDPAKAVVKILAGQELDIPPVASMRGIHIVQGQVTLSANLMGSLIKRSGKYDYRVREHDGKHCKIEFFQLHPGSEMELIGTENYTQEEAQHAHLWGKAGPWANHPKSMLFAAAMREGARRHCGDVFLGGVYGEDELEEIPTSGPAPVITAQVLDQEIAPLPAGDDEEIEEEAPQTSTYLEPDGSTTVVETSEVKLPDITTFKTEMTEGLTPEQIEQLIAGFKEAGIANWRDAVSTQEKLDAALNVRLDLVDTLTELEMAKALAESDPRITPKQRARMWAIAKEAGVDQPEVREVIEGITGDPSSTSIRQSQYDQVVTEIEARSQAEVVVEDLDQAIRDEFDLGDDDVDEPDAGVTV